MSLPQALLNRVEFQPALSSRKLQLIQSMPMGCCIKTMMYYDKTYWRRAGMSGQSATDHGTTVWCIDDTKPDGSAPCIVGFVNGAYVRYDDVLHKFHSTFHHFTACWPGVAICALFLAYSFFDHQCVSLSSQLLVCEQIRDQSF